MFRRKVIACPAVQEEGGRGRGDSGYTPARFRLVERAKIAEHVTMSRPRRLIWLNIPAGLARGRFGRWFHAARRHDHLCPDQPHLNLPIIGNFRRDRVIIQQYLKGKG